MTTVGLVGGLGPESTIDYYRRIIERWQRDDPKSSPPIVIDSLDSTFALNLVAQDRGAFTDYLRGSIRRLIGAGVDFIAMTANTPHMVFDELAAESSVPMLSIVEVCAQETRRRGLWRLLLLGTRFTMQAEFYPTVFSRYGIDVVAPDEVDRTWVHARYVNELLEGDFRDATRNEFITLITRLRDSLRVDGIILGGTELPLLLRASVIAELPVLDTTELHVAAIVNRLLEGGRRSGLAADG
jgi:aspartate racemase